jgi:hypothetical protein
MASQSFLTAGVRGVMDGEGPDGSMATASNMYLVVLLREQGPMDAQRYRPNPGDAPKQMLVSLPASQVRSKPRWG